MGFYPFATLQTAPTGAAGGDLSGTYPNPAVAQVNGQALGSAALLATLGAMALQAATPVAGYTLVNGTGTVISWTAPNDGKLHRALILGLVHVTSTETAGQLNANLTAPDGTTKSATFDGGGHAAGIFFCGGGIGLYAVLVEANTTISVVQQTALTVGAAVLWAEIWGL